MTPASDAEGGLLIGHGRAVSLRVVEKPFNTGQVVIETRRPVGALTDLEDDELLEIGEWIARVEAVMESVYNPQGINVGFNLTGENGGPLRVHMVPRWAGDMNFMPVVAEIKVLPESLGKTLRVYQDALFP